MTVTVLNAVQIYCLGEYGVMELIMACVACYVTRVACS